MENEEEKQREDSEKLFENLKSDKIEKEKIQDAESKSSFLGGISEDFKILLSMLKDSLQGKFTIPTKDLVILIGAISYVALPLDTVPDFIPLIGYLDDIWIVSMVIMTLNSLIKEYKKRKCS